MTWCYYKYRLVLSMIFPSHDKNEDMLVSVSKCKILFISSFESSFVRFGISILVLILALLCLHRARTVVFLVVASVSILVTTWVTAAYTVNLYMVITVPPACSTIQTHRDRSASLVQVEPHYQVNKQNKQTKHQIF